MGSGRWEDPGVCGLARDGWGVEIFMSRREGGGEYDAYADSQTPTIVLNSSRVPLNICFQVITSVTSFSPLG